MDHHSRRTFLAFFCAAFLTALPFGPLFAADAIKLGVAGAHSGDLASYGLPTVKAAELVVKEINAKGGCWADRWSSWWRTTSASPNWPRTRRPSWFPRT